MTLGSTPRQADIFRSTTEFCAPRIAPDSIYALLSRECFALFPDALFGDLFTDIGRRSIPPLIVAVVMVLQRLEGCSDREAVERFTYDARWKYAAGGLAFDYPGFAHTVLVDMRARLARSERPNRIFEVTLEVAHEAGLVGVRRVLDSTPLYDAVATMDTVTLVRSAIRGLLGVAHTREDALRAHLRRDDDYRTAGKPPIDYDDRAAREALVDALTRDGYALLGALDAERLPVPLTEAASHRSCDESIARVRGPGPPSRGGITGRPRACPRTNATAAQPRPMNARTRSGVMTKISRGPAGSARAEACRSLVGPFRIVNSIGTVSGPGGPLVAAPTSCRCVRAGHTANPALVRPRPKWPPLLA